MRHVRVANRAIVWGSGIIDRKDHFRAPRHVLAVRGPRTRERVLELGYSCPEIYGDPAILLPRFFKPDISKLERFQVGIVPHYKDFELIRDRFLKRSSIRVINVTAPVEHVVAEICACNHIISSSLHGLIVSHAYGIPAAWAKTEVAIAGDGIKFHDYAEGVDTSLNFLSDTLTGNESISQLVSIAGNSAIPKLEVVADHLLATCPFAARLP